jgi:hypothetical protein
MKLHEFFEQGNEYRILKAVLHGMRLLSFLDSPTVKQTSS